MKKLLKRIMALSLCACMMMGAASPASAATNDYNKSFVLGDDNVYSPDYYMNMYATSTSSIVNGTDITTWNTRDSSGTQDFDIKLESTGNDVYRVMYLKGSTSKVVSCNRYSGQVEMWTKDDDNPYTEYGLSINPLIVAESPIIFDYISDTQPLALSATGNYVSYGGEHGYKVMGVHYANDNYPYAACWTLLQK